MTIEQQIEGNDSIFGKRESDTLTFSEEAETFMEKVTAIEPITAP
jgi:hypothetical protein